MKQLLDLMRRVDEEGVLQDNRTGVRTKTVSGAMLRFDLAQGFPAVTTKKLAFKSVIGELVGFLRGCTSAGQFRALGCKVWDANANENQAWLDNPFRQGVDDLGWQLYGAAWRRWPAYKEIPRTEERMLAAALASGYEIIGSTGRDCHLLRKDVDQLGDCLRTLCTNPTDRRMVFHAWNPAEIDAVALPCCHVMYILNANAVDRELSMTMTMRSTDVFLGLPFNVASSAALLTLLAHLADYTPRYLTVFLSDAHLYENHLDQVRQQLNREPRSLPFLRIHESRVPRFNGENLGEIVRALDEVEPGDFTLENYQHHDALAAPMAV